VSAPIPGVTLHARTRMAERIGRDLSRAEWLAVVASILDGTATLLMRDGRRGEHYAVAVGAMMVRVAWQPDQGLIATVLPSLDASTPATAKVRRAPLGKSLGEKVLFLRGRRQRTQWI